MGFWTDQVVPRFTDKMLGSSAVMKLRRRAVDSLAGEVVEIGFGSGLNVPLYPPEVTNVYAVDPSLVGRRLSQDRVAASPVRVEFVGLDGAHLPLDDASVDAALSTFTLCTIPDVVSALDEVRRVLRPGGTFHFLEHGLCPDPAVARQQHRFNGIQQRLAGGCHLDRPIDALVREAGFEIDELEHDHMPGPKFMLPWGYLYEGVGRRPEASPA
jgi:ubiquinone/menaquinone biosynthesis C-methylase UbiE